MDAVHQAVGKDVHTLHLLAASAIEAVLDIALVKTALVDGAGRPDQIAPVLEGTDHGQVHILVVIMNAGFHPRAEVPGVVRRGIDNRRVFTVGIHLDRSHGMRGNLNGQGECENIYADILEDGIPPTWKCGGPSDWHSSRNICSARLLLVTVVCVYVDVMPLCGTDIRTCAAHF